MIFAGPMVIHWCSLCSAQPAAGTLRILRKGAMVPDDVLACNDCVEGLSEDDWLDEKSLPMYK